MESFIGLRFFQGDYQLLVKWKGFPEDKATYEKIEQMLADVPETVKEYLRTQKSSSDMAMYLWKLLFEEPIQPLKSKSRKEC